MRIASAVWNLFTMYSAWPSGIIESYVSGQTTFAMASMDIMSSSVDAMRRGALSLIERAYWVRPHSKLTPNLTSVHAECVLTMLLTVSSTAIDTASLRAAPDSRAPTRADPKTSPVPW